jgi:ferredoxin
VFGLVTWAQRKVSGAGRSPDPAERNALVKLQIEADLCQGHGRCYDLAPGLFGEDEEGYGKVLADGVVPLGNEQDARRAELNCPEQAIRLIERT